MTKFATELRQVSQPMRYGLREWVQIIRAAFGQVFDEDMALRCAGVAFFAFLSVFPAMAASVAIFGLIADPSDINIAATPFGEVLPAEIVSVLESQLATFVGREATFGISLLVSFLIAAWTGTRGTNALIFAINKAYQEDDNRSFLRGLGVSILTTFGAVVALVVSISLLAVLPAALAVLPLAPQTETMTLVLRWPIIAIVIGSSLLALYRMTPDRKSARTKWVVPGAIAATVLWLAGSALFSLYIENFGRYQATFGSIAAAAIFMLWLNFTALILVFGACLNAQLEWFTRRDTTIGPTKPMGHRGAVVADTVPDA